jgi:thiamine biosynthesis lipoprotein
MKRRWAGSRGAYSHHLIDPRTGLPADSGIQSVSVVADEAWHAEVLATSAFLAGPSDASDVLTTAGAHGLIVLDDGTIRTTPGWQRFVA